MKDGGKHPDPQAGSLGDCVLGAPLHKKGEVAKKSEFARKSIVEHTYVLLLDVLVEISN